MAQADSVPSSVRVLITGADMNPSTVRAPNAKFLGYFVWAPQQATTLETHSVNFTQNLTASLDLIDTLVSGPASEMVDTLQNSVPRRARRVT